jgi:hypothetical protein
VVFQTGDKACGFIGGFSVDIPLTNDLDDGFRPGVGKAFSRKMVAIADGEILRVSGAPGVAKEGIAKLAAIYPLTV